MFDYLSKLKDQLKMNPFNQSTSMQSTSIQNDEPAQSSVRSSRKRKLTGGNQTDESFNLTPRSSNRSVYLYEKTIEIFPFKKLPSNREVFQRLYNIIIFNPEKTIKECIKQTSKELIELWQKSSIPTIDTEQVKKRISKMYEVWLELKNDRENANLKDEVERKENDIKLKFDDLFDIGHPKAMEMIVNEEDIKFLELQRSKNRPGYISTKEVDEETNIVQSEI